MKFIDWLNIRLLAEDFDNLQNSHLEEEGYVLLANKRDGKFYWVKKGYPRIAETGINADSKKIKELLDQNFWFMKSKFPPYDYLFYKKGEQSVKLQDLSDINFAIPQPEEPVQKQEKPQQNHNNIKSIILKTKWYLSQTTDLYKREYNQNIDYLAVGNFQNEWYLVNFDYTYQILPKNKLKEYVISIRDENNNPISVYGPQFDNIWSLVPNSEKDQQELDDPEELEKLEQNDEVAQSKTIPDSMMSDEQKSIDEKFDEEGHMMINALAGSGKTTMLKHLAYKYGKPGEKWLYLVFNTKNKEEGKQKFPRFVDVQTTNGFLGKVVESNSQNIFKTERMVSISRANKTSLILDNSEKFKK